MSDDKGQKTELPTSRRLEDAKNKGNSVPYSKELGLVLLLLFMIFFVKTSSFEQFSYLFNFLRYSFESSADIDVLSLRVLVVNVFKHFMILLLYPMLALFFISTLSAFLQGRYHLSMDSLSFDLGKVSPMQGIKKIFSAKAIVDFLLSIGKVIIIGYVIYFVLKSRMVIFSNMFVYDAFQSLSIFKDMLVDVLKFIFVTVLSFMCLEIFSRRYFYIKSLMMTKQEVKDELKDTEPRPEIKAKINKLRQSIAKSMIKEVFKSDVVITNPTHFAVALQYNMSEMHAPKVIAKGSNAIAKKIRQEAIRHQIPIVENKPLTQALFKVVDVGDYIPEQYYKAVAEIIKYIYKAKGKL